jgi:hypothetical protein
MDQFILTGEMLHIAIFLTRHRLARGRRQQGPHSGHRSPTSFVDPWSASLSPKLEDTCVVSAETGSDSLAGVTEPVNTRVRSSGQARALTGHS